MNREFGGSGIDGFGQFKVFECLSYCLIDGLCDCLIGASPLLRGREATNHLRLKRLALWKN